LNGALLQSLSSRKRTSRRLGSTASFGNFAERVRFPPSALAKNKKCYVILFVFDKKIIFARLLDEVTKTCFAAMHIVERTIKAKKNRLTLLW
jgi:hypothetical protein